MSNKCLCQLTGKKKGFKKPFPFLNIVFCRLSENISNNLHKAKQP